MQIQAILLNFLYATLGGILTLGFMWIGYLLFDKVTPFDTGKELQRDNRSVGMVILGVFIGIGIAIGLVIGLGLN